MQEWIAQLYENEELLRMGHCQQRETLNLGMGWMYYGLARLYDPKKVVVIGSWRGFVPLIFGKALHDNSSGGQVYFIDPSAVDDFWKKPQLVQEHFQNYGISNIEHSQMTTQEFVNSETYSSLSDIDIVFIDGLHTEEQARFDFEAFEHKTSENSIFVFHDSISISTTTWLYGTENAYERRVIDFIDKLKQDKSLQILDFPFAKGLTFVRKIP